MDTSTYKAQLESEKANLEQQLQTVGRRNPSNPEDWEAETKVSADDTADVNDRAELLDHYGENAAILTDLENRFNDVKDALARIEAGTYGTCEIGNEPIEEDRLAADPAARTCKAHLGQ